MKSLKSSLTLFIICLTLFSFQKTEAERYSLTIEVDGLRNSKGLVKIALYNKENSIPDEHFENYYKIENVAINKNIANFTFLNLPIGKYAISVLHDENSNGKIDKGIVLPKEGVGFSNYSSIGIGNKPNFKKASFELEQNKIIKVKVIYM